MSHLKLKPKKSSWGQLWGKEMVTVAAHFPLYPTIFFRVGTPIYFASTGFTSYSNFRRWAKGIFCFLFVTIPHLRTPIGFLNVDYTQLAIRQGQQKTDQDVWLARSFLFSYIPCFQLIGHFDSLSVPVCDEEKMRWWIKMSNTMKAEKCNHSNKIINFLNISL